MLRSGLLDLVVTPLPVPPPTVDVSGDDEENDECQGNANDDGNNVVGLVVAVHGALKGTAETSYERK